MKLKSGCIFWPQSYQGVVPETVALKRDLECDIAIIGGGISGALAAYYLTSERVQTVLVDRREIGHGSTAASTGLLQYEIDVPLIDLSKQIGRDRAISAYRSSLQALMAFEPLVAELGDPCGLVARPSLYLASKAADVESLRAEAEARRSIQIDASFLDASVLRGEFQIDRQGAIWSPHAFEVDPFHLTLKLIERSMRQGLEVYGNAEVVQYTPTTNGAIVALKNDVRIKAHRVVFATGYETIVNLPAGLTTTSDTFAAVSEPLPEFTGWPHRCLIWETARPYLYVRTTADDRVMVGGADEEFTNPRRREELLPRKTAELRSGFLRLFPQLRFESACAWAGTFAKTRDGLPYIGTLPQFPHVYFALGYGGNGITFSLIAAKIIRDLFLGKASAATSLFAFTR